METHGDGQRRRLALLVAAAVVSFDMVAWSSSPGIPVFRDVAIAGLGAEARGGVATALVLADPPAREGLELRIAVLDGEYLERPLEAQLRADGSALLPLPRPILPGQAFILTARDRSGAVLGEASARLPTALPEGQLDLGPHRLGGVLQLEPGEPHHMDIPGRGPPSSLGRAEVAVVASLLALLPALVALARRGLRAEARLSRRHAAALLALLAATAAASLAASAHYQRTQLLDVTWNLGVVEELLATGQVTMLREAGWHVVASVWFAAFGTRPSPVAMEASARLLGLSFALAAVAATCGAAAALSRDPDVGLAAAALLASTPLFLKYSATVQRDVASTAFSMLAVWAALVYLRRGRSSALALAAAALALAVYTVAVHVVLLPAAALALAAWRVPVRRAAAASAAFAAACAVPVLLITSRVVGAAHVSFLLDPGRVARNAAWLAAFWLGAGHHSLLLAAIAAWGLERLWRERPREARLLAVCFASYLAFMALHEIPIAYCDQDRHLLYSYPLLAVAAGAGLARLARERPRRAALAAAYLLAAHLALSLGPLDVRRCI